MQTLLAIALATLNSFLIVLSQIALWQRKEYRIDRIKDFITSSTWSFKKQGFVVASGLLLAFAWVSVFEFAALLSLLAMFLGHSVRIYKKGVFRPDFTLRASLVFICTIILSILWLPTSGSIPLHLAAFTFFLPLLVAAAVGIISFPAKIKKQRTISQAQAFRDTLKDLTVVGITGSVGKSSTKAYLTHIMGGESETIVATFEHRNSPFSISGDMLQRVSNKTRVYIAELGAYIPGEIAELSRLTKPKIGVVTAITNQHVGLFGSLALLAKTKWELMDSLPSDGIAILNKDDAQIAKMVHGENKKIIWFSATQKADVYIFHAIMHQDTTECTISILGEDHHVVLPTISLGQCVPILAAISAALALQVEATTIIQRLSTLPSLPRTMELRSGISGATVIDDSYSASEASVTNAISYLSAIKAKDIRLVLVPIIELGSESAAVHERVGALLATLPVRVFIYGEENKESLLKGLGNKPKADVVWINDATELSEKVLADISSQSVVLLEGRVPDLVRYSLIPPL